MLFTSSILQESSCLIYLQYFVGELMSYLPPVFCRRARVLFTSSILQESSCLIYVICVSLGTLHFVQCFCFVCLRLVFVLFVFVLSLLPVSLDSTFLIPPSVFSDFYLRYLSMFVLYVSCVSNICQIYFTCYLFISTQSDNKKYF